MDFRLAIDLRDDGVMGNEELLDGKFMGGGFNVLVTLLVIELMGFLVKGLYAAEERRSINLLW